MTEALASPNAAAPATPPTDGGTPPAPAWYESLPADILNDDIKAFKGPDELAKAYIDTKGKIPTVPEKYEFQFPTEFAKEHVDLIHTRAKEIGLTQDQFKQLAERELAALAKATEEAGAEQRKVTDTLRKEWGAQTDANIAKADKLIVALFGDDWTGKFTIGDHAAILKGFHHLSTKLSEDTLRMGGGPMTGPQIGADGNPILSYPNTPSMNK